MTLPPDKELIERANAAVAENLDENGNPLHGTAQGYACALSALTAIEPELVRLREEVERWEPIDTAPKDGSIVWVGNAHNLCVAYWAGKDERCWRNWYRGNRYENVSLGTDAYLPEPIWFEPTHWKQTPKPPTALKGREAK